MQLEHRKGITLSDRFTGIATPVDLKPTPFPQSCETEPRMPMEVRRSNMGHRTVTDKLEGGSWPLGVEYDLRRSD